MSVNTPGRGVPRLGSASILVATMLAAAGLFGDPGHLAFAARAPRPATPLLPSGFSLGIVNTSTDLGWMTSSGVPWGFRYHYLAGGVNTGTGWEIYNGAPGKFAGDYMANSAANGYVPVFSYYEILQSLPASGTNASDREFSNLNNASTMNAYYANFVLLMHQAAAYGGQVIVHIEPDFWARLEQRAAGGSAASLSAKVKSSGYADVAGIDDTAQGFAGALLHLRDKYAPNALLAIHASSWASGPDLATNTNPAVNAVHEADVVAAFINPAGVTSNPWGSTFDLIFNDVADHDAGWWEVVQHDGGAHWWDRTNARLPNFNRWLSFMAELHARTGKPLIEWQVPLGNQYYLTMNNTDGHYQDNRAEIFLANTSAMQAAGIKAILFGGGNAGWTTYTDAKVDGVTNNNGLPTTDLAGGCNACNTNVSSWPDDDGGFLRVFGGRFYHPLPVNRLVPPVVPQLPTSRPRPLSGQRLGTATGGGHVAQVQQPARSSLTRSLPDGSLQLRRPILVR